MTRSVRVYLESGSKRVFSAALDWPGWCRSGKSEDEALATLADYAGRYRLVADLAGLNFPAAKEALAFDVVERLAGSATTDFGAPGAIPAADHESMTAAERAGAAALVRASWEVLGKVAAGAPATLRKGPRGGGRDRDAIVAHVLEAETAYARKLGVATRSLRVNDPRSVAGFRAELVEVIAAGVPPAALTTPARGGRAAAKPWPIRYAARRIAWHVLDHAWEIEDRSE